MLGSTRMEYVSMLSLLGPPEVYDIAMYTTSVGRRNRFRSRERYQDFLYLNCTYKSQNVTLDIKEFLTTLGKESYNLIRLGVATEGNCFLCTGNIWLGGAGALCKNWFVEARQVKSGQHIITKCLSEIASWGKWSPNYKFSEKNSGKGMRNMSLY